MDSDEALEKFREIMRKRSTAEELGICKLDTCPIPREERKCLSCKHLDDGLDDNNHGSHGKDEHEQMISHAEIEAANEHMQTCDSDWAPGSGGIGSIYEFVVDRKGIRCACGWTFEAGDQHKDIKVI